jgi:hypothetical protein
VIFTKLIRWKIPITGTNERQFPLHRRAQLGTHTVAAGILAGGRAGASQPSEKTFRKLRPF